MQLSRLQQPFRAALSSSVRPTLPFSGSQRTGLFRLAVDRANPAVEGLRHATVKAQGAYKLTSKKTIPKKLGPKKTAGQFVIPGNIIYKQRGTIWYPGENTFMGRDHTIHAGVSGYVQFYRDPIRHPKRQFIGVTFNKDDKLPYQQHAMRRRKLGMVAVPRKKPVQKPYLSPSGIPNVIIRRAGYAVASPSSADQPISSDGEKTEELSVEAAASQKKETPAEYLERRRKNQQSTAKLLSHHSTRILHLRKNYSYSESNWAIGRLMRKQSFTKRGMKEYQMKGVAAMVPKQARAKSTSA